MENFPFLPPELVSLVGSEPKDFIVESKRSQSLNKSVSQIFFGMVWIGILLSTGGKDLFSQGNISSIFTPLDTSNTKLILFVFLLIGFLPLIVGIISFFRKGGIFIATPTRLLYYKNGKTESLEWNSFTGNILISGNNITLEMKTGKTNSTRTEDEEGRTMQYSSNFVHDTLYIAGLNDVGEIRICHQRIKEHNPNVPDEFTIPNIPGFNLLSSLVHFLKK